MNSTEKKLLKYFENEMSLVEKNEFEKELASDPRLKQRLNDFQTISNDYGIYREMEVKYSAPVHSSPVSTGKSRSVFSPKFAFSLGILIVMFGLFILLNKDNSSPSLEKVTSEMNEPEASEILQNYKDYYSSSFSEDGLQDDNLENYYYEEIKNDSSLTEYIKGYPFEYADLYSSISDSEADEIFSSLINKKIIQ